METFYTNCRIENHVDRKKSVEVPKLLVDSGAEFSWINAETLKNIGVKREKKDYTFVMANGQHITRAVGFAIIRVGDAVTTDEVVFGEPGDLPAVDPLGAHRLRLIRITGAGGAQPRGTTWVPSLVSRTSKPATCSSSRSSSDLAHSFSAR